MSDEVDVFDLLKRNGLKLAPHVVKVLSELGYNDIYTLIQIEDPESLEKSVVDTFGECPIYQALSEDEKKLLLGPRCWNSPSRFKFLPGEKASLKSIKSMCSSLQEKLPLVYASPSTTQGKGASFNMKATKPTKLPATSSGSSSGNNSSDQKKDTVYIKNESFSAHIESWCNKKAAVVNYGPDNYELRSGARIYCNICHKTWGYSLGLNNYWKTQFTDHINTFHKLKTPGMLFTLYFFAV